MKNKYTPQPKVKKVTYTRQRTAEEAKLLMIGLGAAQVLCEILEYNIDSKLFSGKTKQVVKNCHAILVEKTNEQYQNKDKITGDRLIDYGNSATELHQLTHFVEKAIEHNDALLSLPTEQQEAYVNEYHELNKKYGIDVWGTKR